MGWERRALLLSWSLWACPLPAATVDPCPIYQEAYRQEIRPKVLSGIPFELMSEVRQKDRVLCRRVIHLTYNLWDEVLTLSEGESKPRRFSIQSAVSEICRNLACEYTGAVAGEKVTYKLLLNPMWAGRIARLKAAIPGPERRSLVSIDWAEVAKDMPSEKELVVKELPP